MDSDQGQVVLGFLIVAQCRVHVSLALQVLAPPLVDVPGGDTHTHSASHTLGVAPLAPHILSITCLASQLSEMDSLVLHLVDVDLQGHTVVLQHSGNLEPMGIRLLITERGEGTSTVSTSYRT